MEERMDDDGSTLTAEEAWGQIVENEGMMLSINLATVPITVSGCRGRVLPPAGDEGLAKVVCESVVGRGCARGVMSRLLALGPRVRHVRYKRRAEKASRNGIFGSEADIRSLDKEQTFYASGSQEFFL
jgi:hypothetical protein